MADTILPPDRQVLLVPYDRRSEARRIGATWHPEERVWSVAAGRAGQMPRDMLPVRDRPRLQPPYIRINLVPQTSWGRNLRALMDEDAWREFARRRVYATTGSLCLVCGGRGPSWPVEADEVWRFDDAAGIQSLHAVVPLCPACHEVRSAGYATAQGRGDAAARHLAWVERIPVPQARTRIDDALAVWKRRTLRTWTIDLSVMETRYGMRIEHEDVRTDEANARLVADARKRMRRDGGGSVRHIARNLYGDR